MPSKKFHQTRHHDSTFYQSHEEQKNQRKNKNRKILQYTKLRIGTINLQTGKDELKFVECVLNAKHLNHDVCFFQETHRTGSGEIKFDDEMLKGWRVIYSGFKRKAQAGVAIVLAPHVQLKDVVYVEAGRIIAARVIINGLKFSLVCCYAPTDTKSYSEEQKNTFYRTFKKATSTIKTEYPSYKLIIGGDFNATIGDDCDPEKWNCVGQNNDPDPTSSNGIRLLAFAEENKLSILNSKYGYKNLHRWSFYSNLGYKRRLDYILGEWFIQRFCTNCRVYTSASIGFDSDHKVVVMDCAFPSKRSRQVIFRKKKGLGRTSVNINLLSQNHEISEDYSHALSDNLETSIASSASTPDEIDEIITNAIHKSTEATIPKRTDAQDNKPWVDDTFLKLIESRNKSTTKSEQDSLNKQVRKYRDKLKNDYYQKKASEINMARESRNVEKEFRLARNYTALNKSKQLLIAPNKLKQHFEEHFSPRAVTMQPEVENPELFPHILPPEDLYVNEEVPSVDEIKEALKTLKNNKCQGTDKVYGEQLKYANSEQLTRYILLLMTIIWTTVSVPKVWLTSAITCIHKKGLKSIAKNYRSIFIMSTISTLLPKLIIERLRNVYEILLMDNQFGFRKNRSTTDAIFITREAINSTKNPLYLCMIDLRAAYDHIDRNMLFRVLDIRTKAPLLIMILKSLYTGTLASIKNTVDQFQVHTGCRQGGIESPVLFNIYIDFVLRCAEYEVMKKYPNTGMKYEYQIRSESSTRQQRNIHQLAGHDRLRMLLYADDIIIFCEDPQELQIIVSIYDDTFRRFGLTIATDKTKTMCFNVNEVIMTKKSIISLRGEQIENVRQFKYLGHVLSNENTHSAAFINHQIASAYAKWTELKSVLLDKRIYLSIRIKILESCIKSRLLYSVQAWQLNAKEMKKMEAVWYGFLRRMVKGGFQRKNAPKNKEDVSIPEDEIDWAYKISNQKLLQITNSSEIKHFCDIQHLKYVAHITRLENSSLQKKLLFCKSSNIYSRWKKLSKLMGIDEIQLRRTMRDRKEFQQLVTHIY